MGSAAAEMLSVLEGFIEEELGDQRHLQAMVRQSPSWARQRLRDMAQTADERLELQARLAELGNSQRVTDVDGFGLMPDNLKENF